MLYDSLYSHGFARVAAAVPHLRPAEPVFNAERTLALATEAAGNHAALVVFPELGLSAYAIDDLLRQRAVTGAVLEAIETLADASRELLPVLIVGAPLWVERGLFNCAVVIHRGRVLGVTPKSYLPDYHEYYEERQFRAAREAIGDAIELVGETVPFGNDIVFAASDLPDFAIHAEVCEDVWTPIPPSTYGAMAGATILANLSASNITIGKADFRRTLCMSQSARTFSAYIYTAAGQGESTTDLAWDGQAMICENGDMVAEAERFSEDEQLLYADIDLDRIVSDRGAINSFGDSIGDHRERLQRFRTVTFELGATAEPAAAAAPDRALPVRPRGPGDALGALLRGLQHPGPRARDAPARDRDREGRDRRLGRPGLDARADRRRTRDGPPRPAARERARVHDAGLRHVRAHEVQRVEADARARRRARARSTSARRRSRCSPTSSTRTRAARSATTSRSRTSRRASARATCSGSPTTTTGS